MVHIQPRPLRPLYHQTPQVKPPPPNPPYPQTPEVQPSPPHPPYPQTPQVKPDPPPPPYPQTPQIQPPPPKTPTYPQTPQVQPSPPRPPYPQTPQVKPDPPPPPYPQTTQVQPPPPKTPTYPQTPQVQPSPPHPPYPQTPQVKPDPPPPPYPQTTQVQPPPPKTPTYPQTPQVQPSPPHPPYPQTPQVKPDPPPPPYPQTTQVQPPPPKTPTYPQTPQVQPSPPHPPYPQTPQVKPDPQPPPYPQTTQVQPPPPKTPTYPQTTQVQPPPPKTPTYPQMPQQTTFQSCEVAQSQRIPCGGSDISAAACESISCCSDGRQCYFGKAVTVQCTKDAKFIVVVAKDATLPNIDLEAISLLGGGQGCTHVDSNSQFAIYQFPVTACGSLVKEEPGVIIYENKMTCAYEVGVGPLGATTRDRHYEVLFQCRYIGTSVETLVVEVLPLQNPPLPVAGLGPISVKLRLANGQCSSKGCNEVDVAYSSFYSEADYPVRKVLRDPVYVDVQLLGKTDPLLVLTLGRCWATTSPEPHSLPQWDILIDGCPYRDDRYLSSLVPVDHASGFPSHHKHFIFKMFTFLDPSSMATQREMVYIHCSTAVCYAAPGTRCEPVCYRRTVSQEKSEQRVVVSSGPVAMVSPQQ
uniref:Zona pellucida sperm-binding protein 4 n=1 Tax=Amphiprion percula TaxID=161767 RepID=A0A3P8SBT3_AMPPE